MNLDASRCMESLGITNALAVYSGSRQLAGSGSPLKVSSPIDASLLADMKTATADQVADTVRAARKAFGAWRHVPAPRRGELVRQFGQILREHKEDLAELVTLEAGKINQEALGEVQEMIDVCDFAVGLSRQLYGLTIASERPRHRLMEQWHPLGPVGIISAFNFPVAVWAWNAALAIVCGDSVVWKPSEKTPLCAIACQNLLNRVAADFTDVPEGLTHVLVGRRDVGAALAADASLPLVSATGSVGMGRSVAQIVAARLGRSLLELGGNNGMIVCPSADLDLALQAIVFSAVGTCGQRCTSLRRLLLHDQIADTMTSRLVDTYAHLPIGDPRDARTLVGPLIDGDALEAMDAAIAAAQAQGGTVLCGGGRVRTDVPAGGIYVRPAIIQIDGHAKLLEQETFAPILYVVRFHDFDEAILMHNSVPQGLASAVFTRDVLEAESFCSPAGSDCGIANVNIGTSGAEIGGAFGGEKDTGGGRESGSDAWKNYMRRATNTINYSDDLPLAQGIRFG